MSLEEAADNTNVMTTNKITRVGLQDDMYAVAGPEDLTSLLEELKIELQACGHRLFSDAQMQDVVPRMGRHW